MNYQPVPAEMNNEYKIIQWNCNGFLSHLDEIKLILSKINCLAICIQESRFRSNCYTNLKNFKCFYKNVDSTSIAHGGVCIYLNNNIDGEEIQLNTELQVVAIKVKFPIKCIICSIYLPGSEGISRADLDSLISQFDHPYILLGDFNSHNPIWGSEKTDSRGKLIQKFLEDNDINIMNNVNFPTHFSFAYKTFSNIDLSLISPSIERHFDWSICDDLHNSDHYPILIKFNGFTPSFPRRSCWNIKKANWNLFDCNLNVPFENFNNVDEIERYITDTIIGSAELAIPYRKSDCKRMEVPWWNDTISQLIRERRKLLKKFKRNMTSENLAKFLKIKAMTRKAIRKSRRDTWMEFCKSINLRTSTSEVYRRIKSINGCSNNQQILAIEDTNGLVTERKDIADSLARHFSNNSSSSNYSSKFRSYAAVTDFPLNTIDNNSVYNQRFTLYEMKSALESCRGTSPGPDNVRYEMVKNLSDSSKIYLLNFYNLIWMEKVFPVNWRKALVIPILKSGKEATNRNNYRPISLTNCLCKLLERMVNKRLVWYIEKNCLLNINQSGFRRNRSTIDNLAVLHSHIMESFSTKKDLIAVFFDIRKAYDCVWRKLIFQKLIASEIEGNMAAFISNFLKNREFSCLVGNTLSDYFCLENGVPQGSVLSVTLFLLAIDSIFTNITKDVKALLFADDLVIYCSGKNVSVIQKKIQKTLNKLMSWTDITGFQFHEEKTVAIKFSRRNIGTPRDINLRLFDKDILFVDKHTFLGVIFDKKLTFQYHIQYIKARANSKLNIIKMLRCTQFGSDPHTLLRILCSIVLPTLDYASMIYSSATESRLKTLNSILNSGIRLAIGAFRTSPADSLQVLASCPPLHLRRLRQLLNYTLKIFSLKSHPFYKMITDVDRIEKFKSKARRHHPVYLRASLEFQKILSRYSMDTDNIEAIVTPNIAPWTFSKINIDYSLTYCTKKEMLPTEIHKRYLEIINTKFKDHICYYTDGSVTDEKAGFAILWDRDTIIKRIQNFSSIYTSELLAIKTCVENIVRTYSGQKILILTDSKSSLEGLSDSFSKNSIIQQLRSILSNVPNHQINFMWIPSHFNIRGNETVDQLAKDALTRSLDSEFKFQYTDYKRSIRKYIYDLWNDLWSNNYELKLHQIQNHIPHRYIQSQLPTTDLIKLNRLKIGHSLLTHKHIIEKTSPPECECGQILTIHHIFNQCSNFLAIRNKYKIRDIKILSNENEFKNVKKFLTEINIYNSI